MIRLFYKEYELGVLTFDTKTQEFVYNSNIEKEKKAKEKYSALDFYYLTNSVDKRSKNLFRDFIVFTGILSRQDIIERANINKEDSLFEKLQKFAKLDMFDEEFYIKVD